MEKNSKVNFAGDTVTSFAKDITQTRILPSATISLSFYRWPTLDPIPTVLRFVPYHVFSVAADG